MLQRPDEVPQGARRWIGKDFDVVTVSFDPEETPELAVQEAGLPRRYDRQGAEAGWLGLGREEPDREPANRRLPLLLQPED